MSLVPAGGARFYQNLDLHREESGIVQECDIVALLKTFWSDGLIPASRFPGCLRLGIVVCRVTVEKSRLYVLPRIGLFV